MGSHRSDARVPYTWDLPLLRATPAVIHVGQPVRSEADQDMVCCARKELADLGFSTLYRAIPATSTSVAAPMRCARRWRPPSSARPTRPAASPASLPCRAGSAAVLGQHGDDDRRIFGALAFVDGRGI